MKYTFIVLLVLFVSGPMPAGEEFKDERTRVVLEAVHRDHVLLEMRMMLESIHGILQGIEAQDLAAIGHWAGKSGMSMAMEVNPVVKEKLPAEFRTLGMSVHQEFDALAAKAKAGATVRDATSALSSILGKCVGCHASYRLDEAR